MSPTSPSLDWRKFDALNILCFVMNWLFGPNFAYLFDKSSMKSSQLTQGSLY